MEYGIMLCSLQYLPRDLFVVSLGTFNYLLFEESNSSLHRVSVSLSFSPQSSSEDAVSCAERHQETLGTPYSVVAALTPLWVHVCAAACTAVRVQGCHPLLVPSLVPCCLRARVYLSRFPWRVAWRLERRSCGTLRKAITEPAAGILGANTAVA